MHATTELQAFAAPGNGTNGSHKSVFSSFSNNSEAFANQVVFMISPVPTK
jgi:hypothetical protein